MRRFTRSINAFSRKMENLGHAVALVFLHYNFCRVHQSLNTTAAIAAGIENCISAISDIVMVLNNAENTQFS